MQATWHFAVRDQDRAWFYLEQKASNLATTSGPRTSKVANVKYKIAERAGNFSVKRKRNLDPLHVSEIIFTQSQNLYILSKTIKAKRKLAWLSIFWEALTKSKNSSKKLETWKTRGKKLKGTKYQGWRFYAELKTANTLVVVKVICWNLQMITWIEIISVEYIFRCNHYNRRSCGKTLILINFRQNFETLSNPSTKSFA